MAPIVSQYVAMLLRISIMTNKKHMRNEKGKNENSNSLDKSIRVLCYNSFWRAVSRDCGEESH